MDEEEKKDEEKKVPTPKRVKPLSRPKRWAAAVGDARSALDNLITAIDELKDLQSEYQDWYDNMPENLQQGGTGEKLEAIAELDFDCTDDVSNVIDEAESIDLPVGFGRD